MSQQSGDDKPVTLINVFEIATADLEAFVAQWEKRAALMRAKPGFRSFHLYRALSSDARFQLINVAEWDTEEDLRAATSDDQFRASVQASSARFDVSAYPAVYRPEIAATV
jgi:heme-degrading monooxygenase HmoA